MAFQRIPCVKAWSSTVLLGNHESWVKVQVQGERVGKWAWKRKQNPGTEDTCGHPKVYKLSCKP